MGWFSDRLKGLKHNFKRATSAVGSALGSAAHAVTHPIETIKSGAEAVGNGFEAAKNGVVDFVATNPVIGALAAGGDKISEGVSFAVKNPGKVLNGAYNGLADAGDWLSGYYEYVGENPGEAIGDIGLGITKAGAETWGLVQHVGHGAWNLVEEGAAQAGNLVIVMPTKAFAGIYNNTLALPEDQIKGLEFFDNVWDHPDYMDNNNAAWSNWYCETTGVEPPSMYLLDENGDPLLNANGEPRIDPDYTFRKGSVVIGQVGGEIVMIAATAGAGGVIVGAAKGSVIATRASVGAIRAGQAISEVKPLATVFTHAGKGGRAAISTLARPYGVADGRKIKTAAELADLGVDGAKAAKQSAHALQESVNYLYRQSLKPFAGDAKRMARAVELASERGFDSVEAMVRYDLGPTGVKRYLMSMDAASESLGAAASVTSTPMGLDKQFAGASAKSGAETIEGGVTRALRRMVADASEERNNHGMQMFNDSDAEVSLALSGPTDPEIRLSRASEERNERALKMFTESDNRVAQARLNSSPYSEYAAGGGELTESFKYSDYVADPSFNGSLASHFGSTTQADPNLSRDEDSLPHYQIA